MRILIAVATRHGSTLEIAEALAAELRRAEHEVEVCNISGDLHVEQYDAVLIGSAAYMGNWLPEARRFVEHQQAELRARPVWLFSSGPLSTDTETAVQPNRIAELMAQSGARGHQTFVGKLERAGLNVCEKLVMKLVKAPQGDFRNWDAIRAWAAAVARELPTGVPVG
jgi:menaquinone-dependent protoporphyrinogen oxidase